MHPHPVVGLWGLCEREEWGVGSGLCLAGGRGGRGETASVDAPGDPCPSLLPLLPAPVRREGLTLCPAWVAPEESETQHKLWPRLPFLCEQDLELRTPRSGVPSDGWAGGGVFHLDRP